MSTTEGVALLLMGEDTLRPFLREFCCYKLGGPNILRTSFYELDI